MTTPERQSFIRWLKGIPYEIKFWNSYYSHSKSLSELYSWSDYGKKCHLDNFDIQGFLSNSGKKPLMIDVGCALSYVLGTEFDNSGTELHLIDPLAKFYNQILDKTHNKRMRLKEGMIELLSTIYAPGTVDLVHVRNALDHCANPMLGIFEGLQVLRTGGVLYLHHHINEAERESYNGFHQYNIDCKNNNLIIWNQKDHLNVSEILADFATVNCSIYDNRYVIAVITKLKDTPSNIYNSNDTPLRATEMMNLTISSLNSPRFVISFHSKKLIAGIAHYVMRRIPRKSVEYIKALVRSATNKPNN